MINDLAVVIHTCDKYKFAWEGWWKTFSEHWDFNLGIDIYFANEIIDVNFDGIKQLKTGEGEWSDRLNRAFNMIPHKHVLYWQEDMWMINKLDDFSQYYNDFVKYDMDYLMFMTQLDDKNEHQNYFKFNDKIIEDKYLHFNSEITPWIIFHQPAIWKKDFFLEYLQHSEDPWVNEIEGTLRAKENHKIKEIKIYNVKDLCMWYASVVHRGKFLHLADQVLNGVYKQ